MDWDPIWKRARSDLTVTTALGEPDVFLWEHSARVAGVALRIAELEVVRAQDPDKAAILAAALYHDVAWAIRSREGELDRTEILLTPLNEMAAEQSALLMEEKLADLLPPGSLERAARAVRLMHEREPAVIEAQVIAEANNLEEFGLLSLWIQIRRGMLDGRGTQAVIESWQRKKEYHFWSARLRDSFRFEPTRRLAEQRLAKLERLMRELDEQFTGSDMTFGTAARSRVKPHPSKPS